MTPGLEAGSGDGIYASLLKCRRLIGCCRRADRDDALRPALLKNFPWRNSDDEAECRYVRVQQHASLIFKSDRRIRLVRWKRRSQGGEMAGKRRQAPDEGAFI